MSSPVPVDPEDPSTWGDFTPSTKRLNDMVGVITHPRRLTPEEIELLVKSKREMALRAEYLYRIKTTAKPQKD